MKKIIKILALSATLVFCLFSCRPYEDLSRDFDTPTTWGEFFDLYWKRMSTNYAFWELDYNGGKDWDRIYDEYMPLFTDLGPIQNNVEGRDKAYSYLYDIIEPLSDGHYDIRLNTSGTFNLGDGDSIWLSPSYARELRKHGYTKEEIIKFLMLSSPRSDSTYNKYYESCYDKPQNIENVLRRAGFTIIDKYSDNPNASLYAILAKNSEDIIYFGFSDFSFSYLYLNNYQGIEEFITTYFDSLSSAKGVIIDLRGNMGGNTIDLSLLWTPFFTEDITKVVPVEDKMKEVEGRTSYGPWIGFAIEKNEANYRGYGHIPNKEIPIAILQDEESVSCAEVSILFFHLLEDRYGYNTETFGERTVGGFGSLVSSSEYLFNGGTTYDLAPYCTMILTSYCITRSYDGNIYEGVGIPADNEIDVDYNDFINGNDALLNAALSWIEGSL